MRVVFFAHTVYLNFLSTLIAVKLTPWYRVCHKQYSYLYEQYAVYYILKPKDLSPPSQKLTIISYLVPV
jgi:hypothetical protein